MGIPAVVGVSPELGPHPWVWGHPEPPEAPMSLAQSSSLRLDFYHFLDCLIPEFWKREVADLPFPFGQ